MDDLPLMGVTHRLRQIVYELRGNARNLRIAIDELCQAPRVDKFESAIRQPVLLADFVNLHDVRMLQPRDRLGLALKAGALGGPCMAPGEDHLQGDLALEGKLASAE